MMVNLAPVLAWLPGSRLSWTVLAVWLVVVLAYGLRRSLGEAPQDPLRPSGPVID